MLSNIAAVSVFTIAVSYLLEEKNKWIGHVSGVLLIILIAIFLGNTGLISQDESTYGPIMKWSVPLGIALMLMAFNPKQVLRLKKEYIICFIIGTIASIVGGLIAGLMFRQIFPDYAWQVAGQLTASYIGGYENAVAISSALNTPREVFLTAFAGDSIFTAGWMIVNIIHGKTLKQSSNNKEERKSHNHGMTAMFDLSSLSIMLASAVAALFLATFLHSLVPSISKIIWLSAISTGLTFLPWRDRFQGAYVIGSFVLSLFFFACGAISNITLLFNSGSLLVFFPALIVAIHGIILFSLTKILGLSSKASIVASQSLIGGPATALAVVQALKWDERSEAIIMGLLGYAISNYIGYGVAMTLFNI